MPGLLGDMMGQWGQSLAGGMGGGYGSSPGLLGGIMGQWGGLMDQSERQEYEKARAQGFTGTFEQWKQQKAQKAQNMGMANMNLMGGY